MTNKENVPNNCNPSHRDIETSEITKRLQKLGRSIEIFGLSPDVPNLLTTKDAFKDLESAVQELISPDL